MPFVAAKCTQCGANIEVDDTKEAGICKYCGTAYITEKAINNYNITNNYNIQSAVINVQGVNVDNIKKLGDEKIQSLNYPFEMDNYVKAQEFFAKVLEYEDSVEYRLKYDLCDRANHPDRTSANELVNIVDWVIDFIKNDGAQNNNIEDRAVTYAALINVMQDVVSATNSYYYKRFMAVSLNYSVFISMLMDVVKKELECAELMSRYANIPEVNEAMIMLCKTCEGQLATCISNYSVGNNTYSLPSEAYPEVKALAERVQMTGKQFMSSYQVRDDILNPGNQKSSNGCYVASCVYGSYDCPEVWTLRRFRDDTLDATWYGRLFIRCYYAVSPNIVKWFGQTKWFKTFWKARLDKMVRNLNGKGVSNTSYNDKY